MTADAAANTSLQSVGEAVRKTQFSRVDLREVESLEKKNTKLENDLKFKTSKNIELYQRVFWLEAQLKRQLENNTGMNSSTALMNSSNPLRSADVSMNVSPIVAAPGAALW